MLCKLTVRNIRRSIRDYAIYFVTLTIGVAIFYAFNSIESQQVLFDLEEQSVDSQMFEMTQYILSMFSGVIACVLGFLVIYANQFLIKRRKKEFGTYLLLGMRAEAVSAIVLMETLIVGVIALVLGLLVGFLISQGLSFATAVMFGVQIKNYQFVFSSDACIMALVCFAIIFCVVAVFNTFSVNRYKLIDLLDASKRNERGGTRNPVVCLLVFIASLLFIAYAYEQLAENKMIMLDDPTFSRATIFMLVGSLLFFWSLAGFAVAVITRIKGVYLKGLTMFSVRQVASRINTAFLSLWAVCILLFFSITTFSCGMGLVKVFTGDIQESAPYDASIQADVWYENYREKAHPQDSSFTERAEEMKAAIPAIYDIAIENDWDMASVLRERAPEQWDKAVASHAQFDMYEAVGTTYEQLYGQVRATDPSLVISEDLFPDRSDNITVLPLSQLNRVLEMGGKNTVTLENDQFAMINNFAGTEQFAKLVADSNMSLQFGDETLYAASGVIDAQLANSAMVSSVLIFTVPDNIVNGFIEQGAIPFSSLLDITYKQDVGNAGEILDSIVESAKADISSYWPASTFLTQEAMVAQAGGMRMMIIYLALYIGFVFLMATATILAIQRLSDAADSQPSYRTLSQLGCDRKMINRSILVQTLIYFLVPLGLAVCHSACAIGVLNDAMFVPFGQAVVEPIIMAACLVVGIYGIYMLITYVMSKSVVRS